MMSVAKRLVTLQPLLLLLVGSSNAEVHTLAPETLKQTVFDDGEPWLIVCLPDSRSGSDPVHEVVGSAARAKTFPEDVSVGVLDCRAKLPSGKTPFQRFKLDTKVEPVLFVVSGGETTQITAEALQRHYPKPTATTPRELFASVRSHARALAALVAKLSAPHVGRITSDKELRACTRRRACALVLTSDEPSSSQQRLVEQLGRSFRHVHVGVLHLGRYEFSLESKLPAKPTRAEPRVLVLKADTGPGKKRSEALGARVHRGEWTLESVSEFVRDALEGEQDLVPLKKHPSVRWRSAKKSASPPASPPPKRSARGSTASSQRAAARGDAAPDAEAAARERERRRAMDLEGDGLLFESDDDDAGATLDDEDDGNLEELVIDDEGDTEDDSVDEGSRLRVDDRDEL